MNKYLDHALLFLVILLIIITTLGIFPYVPEAALLIIIIVWIKEWPCWEERNIESEK